MDIRLVVIEIAEKGGLLTTAGLVSVLVPPLRNRLLGLGGQPRDRVAAFLLGFSLSMWGAKMGVWWLEHHVNIHAIGVMIAALLGGARTGLLTGLFAGLFYVYRVEPSLGLIGVTATILEGALAGWIVEKRPHWFSGWRTFTTACLVQVARALFLGVYLALTGDLSRRLEMTPALGVQMLGVASGLTFWIFSARVVLAREEAAIALVEARAAADHLALEALRRRLEPHFLFNALNTLRATIRRDPARARDLVSDLSDLYRYLLNHPEDAPVSSEVEHACAYLAIEQARLGEGRLRVERAVDDEVAAARIPALTLQPLVENAVKHGVGAHETGVVRLEARREGRALIVEVHDQSEGEHLGKLEAGHGIALKTLRERLTKRFGDSATLELLPKERGTIARVTLPWQAVTPDDDPSSEERDSDGGPDAKKEKDAA
ncbi:MAG: histidine kinase [Sandaracinus sp.]|nr:histidine kinase [Myxococcales bacterium]MCB9599334.1 histidine kinase [Sandaracinus sp.]MCB9634156.1 histidine kinase [Sandaracinus sp.]